MVCRKQERSLPGLCGPVHPRLSCVPPVVGVAGCWKRALEHGPWEGPVVGCEGLKGQEQERHKCGSLQKKPEVRWKPGTIAEGTQWAGSFHILWLPQPS